MYDRKEADARYRSKDRVAYNARITKWKKDNPDKAREQNLSYKSNHRDELKINHALYREFHKEEAKQHNAEYYKKHPEEYRERLSKWRKENPERAKVQIHTRRTRKTQAGGTYSEEEWLTLCKYHYNRCVCCGRKEKLTPDHIIPVAKGGSSNISNIQPLCQPCNSRKSTRTIDYAVQFNFGYNVA